MPVSLSSKLPDVGTTIFTVMSQLAADCNAINLSQGFPAFEPPGALTERIAWHLGHGANQYAPMAGVPALREAIAAKSLGLYGCSVNPDAQVTVCSGATEGIFSAVQAVVQPGDEVIVLDPAYDSYEPSITLAGGVAKHVSLQVADNGFDFRIDWQRLQDAISANTRMIMLNFPHNPTGAVLSAADLDRLADLLRDTDILIMSDEVYEHIVFDGVPHHSLAGHDELRARSFVISSFGKTFHATGWKIGYCIAPAALTAEFRKVHQFVTFAVSTPMQHAIADYLAADCTIHDDLPVFYQRKRDLFCRLLGKTRFRFAPARSTFFQVVDYGDISDQPDTELAKRWTHEAGVASIPLSVFCEQPTTGTRLRLCFAKDDATLEQAAARLSTL